MDNINLKYQIVLFGDFSSIQPTPDIVKKLMEIMQTFTPYNLLLNTMNELTIDTKTGVPTQSNRVSFTDNENGLQIKFGSKRIDFMKESRNADGSNMGELNDFIAQVKGIVVKLSNACDEIKKFNRLSLVQEGFMNVSSDAKKDGIYKKLLNETFFSSQSTKEWNVRIVDKQNGKALDEQINTILSVDRVQGKLEVGSYKKDIDEIKFLIDINTNAQDTSLRFDVTSLDNFIMDSLEKNILVHKNIEQKLLQD